MAHWQIENGVSAVVLGVYEGATEHEALDAMAKDAGYADYAAACEVQPAGDGELHVTPACSGCVDAGVASSDELGAAEVWRDGSWYCRGCAQASEGQET